MDKIIFEYKLNYIGNHYNYSNNIINKINLMNKLRMIILDDCLSMYNSHLNQQMKDIFYNGRHHHKSYVI